MDLGRRRLASGDASSAESSMDKARRYMQQKERQQGSQAGDGLPDVPPPSWLAAEYDEDMQAYFMSAPSGLGALAENQIRAGIKAGALDNLKGKGKPLSQEDHSAQFYHVDPLIQAMTRTMGAQNMRPESLDRRDQLLRQLDIFRCEVAAEVSRALEGARAGPGAQASEATAAPSGAGGSSRAGGGFFGRLWRQLAPYGGGGAAGQAAGGGAGGGRGRGWTLEGLRTGQHEGLRIAIDEVNTLVKQYNSAVLEDKETYGPHWPLNEYPRLNMAAEVDHALAKLGAEVAQQKAADGSSPS